MERPVVVEATIFVFAPVRRPLSKTHLSRHAKQLLLCGALPLTAPNQILRRKSVKVDIGYWQVNACPGRR